MGLIIGFIIMVAPIAAGLSCITYLPIAWIHQKRHGKSPWIRHLANFVFIGIIWSILYITILIYGTELTFHPGFHMINLIPFVWVKETYTMGMRQMLSQLIMNIIMLIPVGFLLPIIFSQMRKFYRTVLCIALFILVIETIQYFIGRSADIDDLIMNTVGGMIGYAIYAVFNKCFKNMNCWKKAKAVY